MARHTEPTPEQVAGYEQWRDGLPEFVRKAIGDLNPWTLYRLKSTGHRVTLLAVGEPKDPAAPVTVTVAVLAQYNQIAFERKVFGIDPADLEECDLPGPDEPVGLTMTPEEAAAHIDEERAKNGLPPLESGEPDEAWARYKIWIEMEAESEDGEEHRTCDLPFSSLTTFGSEDAALEFCQKLQAVGRALSEQDGAPAITFSWEARKRFNEVVDSLYGCTVELNVDGDRRDVFVVGIVDHDGEANEGLAVREFRPEGMNPNEEPEVVPLSKILGIYVH